MTKTFSLKDHLFNKKNVAALGKRIHAVYPSFDEKKFVRDTVTKFPELELKQRIVWIREKLEDQLPTDYQEATTILLKALPEPCDPTKIDDDFGDFIYAPLNDFVVAHGCTKKDLAFSLNALKEITQRFSAEDAIRPFINNFEKETLATLKTWSTDSHYHVRRLVSEGTRPKLPWAKKITMDYHKAIPLLDTLYRDNTRFVTRSVANHMNDISKNDPELCIKTLKQWRSKTKGKEQDFITRHSLRTLIKQGHPGAMELLGFSSKPSITFSDFSIKQKKIHIGEAVTFSFSIKGTKDENLMIDYVMHFQTKSNKGGVKVHKIKQASIKKGEILTIEKKHLFKKNMTTREFQPGIHWIEIQINGVKQQKKSFALIV